MKNKIYSLLTICSIFLSLNIQAYELRIIENEWISTGKTLEVYSKKGYLSSIKYNNVEFLAQKNVFSGSYIIHQKKTLPLSSLSKVADNKMQGTNTAGKMTYVFNEHSISCTFHNTSEDEIVWYFIIDKYIKTLVDNEPKESANNKWRKGSTFNCTISQQTLIFQTNAVIWPWNDYQAIEIKIKPGQTSTVKINPPKTSFTPEENEPEKPTNDSKKINI